MRNNRSLCSDQTGRDGNLLVVFRVVVLVQNKECDRNGATGCPERRYHAWKSLRYLVNTDVRV